MNNREKSLTKNGIYYTVYQVLNVLFPFLTGMYVARILLPAAVGTVSYAQNIAQYFVMLSGLGIPTYGMREIAKVRYNKKELSKIFSELWMINIVSTFSFSILYLILILSVEDFRNNLQLYLVTGGAIALNIFNIEWLYIGLEEFDFMSVRNIIFKVTSFILLVCLVHKQDDYLIYAFITVLGTAGNYLVNVIFSHRFTKLSFEGLEFKKHIKPILTLVFIYIAIELYLMVDVTMLGIISEEENVAYYTYANKIYRIFLQLINSITIVVVPRLAFYYKENENNKINEIITKVTEIIFLLSLPIIAGIQVIASDVVSILYGDVFLPSASVLRILSIILLIEPIGYLLGSRMLLITNHEASIALCELTAAISNIAGNAILIVKYQEAGAAIASVGCRIISLIFFIIFGKKYYKFNKGITIDILKIIMSTSLMGLTIYFLHTALVSIYIRITVIVLSAVTVYFVSLLALREKIAVEYTRKIIQRIRQILKN